VTNILPVQWHQWRRCRGTLQSQQHV